MPIALGITGVRITQGDREFNVRARRGVVLGTGGFEWDPKLVEAYLRGPMRGAVSPPNNTGDGLRMAMAHGADLANMGEAWWVPIVQLPGDTFEGQPRSRSVRLERTRPRSIIVNRAGKRFLNEAGEYNSMAGPFHFLDPQAAATRTIRRGSSSTRCTSSGTDSSASLPDEAAPDWFCAVRRPRRTRREDRYRRRRTGRAHSQRGTTTSPHEHDPDFGRGASAYDGYWGDDKATTPAGKTLGPIDTAPYYAVPVSIGAMGTKGGPRTDRDGRVLHVSGAAIPGCSPRATRWPARRVRPTAERAERSAPQWCSAIAPGWPSLRGSDTARRRENPISSA